MLKVLRKTKRGTKMRRMMKKGVMTEMKMKMKTEMEKVVSRR